ncbi:Uncharacterised protein [Mycobacterium tuberculosis]|nr:Uncharacterised protein [Mycobacterium tuberculosis]
MYTATNEYFRSGQRVCLVGVVALGASRDLFFSRALKESEARLKK